MAVASRKVRKATGLEEEVCPYSLHSWATLRYAQTKDWDALLDQGGWNLSDTANRYRRIAPGALGRRLLSHGWNFRDDPGETVQSGELVSLRIHTGE